MNHDATLLKHSGIASGQIAGLAPIPVPGFPGPQDVPTVPGVNTIPGLSNFNYLVSSSSRFFILGFLLVNPIMKMSD